MKTGPAVGDGEAGTRGLCQVSTWPPAGPRAAKPAPGRRAQGAGPTYAALDLGTNNCRLLVARPTAEGFRVIDAFSRIVRLGEGLSLTGRLGEAAIERTLEALRICRDKMAARGVTRARTIATEACRSAVNGAEFVDEFATGSASSSKSSTARPRRISPRREWATSPTRTRARP